MYISLLLIKQYKINSQRAVGYRAVAHWLEAQSWDTRVLVLVFSFTCFGRHDMRHFITQYAITLRPIPARGVPSRGMDTVSTWHATQYAITLRLRPGPARGVPTRGIVSLRQ